MSTPNKIALIFHGRYEEKPAAAALKPGYLIYRTSDDEVAKHASSGGITAPIFAFEDALRGASDGTEAPRNIMDAFAADDMVPHGYCLPGDVVLARLAAAATAVVIGSLLMSNGDGCLALRTSTNHIIAYAEEAVDNSAGSEEVFIKVRIAG